jgi:hypothetical protein
MEGGRRNNLEMLMEWEEKERNSIRGAALKFFGLQLGPRRVRLLIGWPSPLSLLPGRPSFRLPNPVTDSSFKHMVHYIYNSPTVKTI